jgi:hypothetical protein
MPIEPMRRRPAGWFDFAPDQAKQCRLAGAVAADDAGALARLRERQPVE